MGKLGILFVALLLSATASCYNADVEATLSSLPVVGAIVAPSPAAPEYVHAIGTPAANNLPETDMATWFDPSNGDPYDVERWRQVRAYATHMGTPGGFADVCKRVGEAAGADRAAKPELGALACSSDGTVTQLQRFAAQLLTMQADVVLWYRGVPGASIGAVRARQAEIQLACSYDVVARQGGPGSPFGTACASALETAYESGDAVATIEALAQAYAAVAADLAARDADIDPEPGYFEPAKPQ